MKGWQWIQKLNYGAGLWRLWIVATVVWFIAALALNAYGIFYWIGFHYPLLRDHGSIRSALIEKEKVRKSVEACRAVEQRICTAAPLLPSDPLAPDYDRIIDQLEAHRRQCIESDEFAAALLQEYQVTAGAKVDSRKAAATCIFMSRIDVPDINWLRIVLILLAPLVPLGMYFVGRWVGRGFSKSN